MSRTIAAKDTPTESFSSLLDRLTRRADSSEEASSRLNLDELSSKPFGTDRYTPSRNASPQERRRVIPLVAPVPAVKRRQSKGESEEMELSYEKALRLHGRRKLSATPSNGSRKVAEPAKSPATPAARPLQPEQPTNTTSARKESKLQSTSDSRIVSRQVSRTKGPSKQPPHKASSSRGGSRTETAPTTPKQKSKSVKLGTKSASQLQIELPSRTSQLEQRRSILSIRLNEHEAERLRLRAAESGISVSAYMRSCVLDAEQLRTQVKEALAEMRSAMDASMRASIHTPMQPQATRPSDALRSTGRLASYTGIPRVEQGAGWPRFLWKSATFLLGPLLAFRHRG